jgi:cytochrome c peroxidase
MPEVPNNIDMTIGMLGLTDAEEDQIVIFLQTLTDGFTTPYPDIDTFTGTCMEGGSAATPMPPCLVFPREQPLEVCPCIDCF